MAVGLFLDTYYGMTESKRQHTSRRHNKYSEHKSRKNAQAGRLRPTNDDCISNQKLNTQRDLIKNHAPSDLYFKTELSRQFNLQTVLWPGN